MKFNVTSANVNFKGGQVFSAQVYFEAYNEERTINLSGYKTLTPEEYIGNESPEQLKEIIKQVLTDQGLYGTD